MGEKSWKAIKLEDNNSISLFAGESTCGLTLQDG